MILNIVATLFVLFLLARMAITSIQVWAGPYEEKGKFILISAGQAAGFLLVLWAVWS